MIRKYKNVNNNRAIQHEKHDDGLKIKIKR